MNHKKLYFIGLAIVVCLTAAYALFSKRDQLLWSVMQKRVAEVEAKTSSSITIRSLKMDGVNRLRVSDIVWITSQKDTFLTVKKASLEFKLSNLFRFNANVESLDFENVRLYYNDINGIPILRLRKDSVETTDSKSGPLSSCVKLYEKLLGFFPDNMSVSDAMVLGYRDSCRFTVSFPESSLKNGTLESVLLYESTDKKGQNTEKSFVICGDLNNPHKQLSSLRIYPTTSASLPLTFEKGGENISVSFDTMFFSFASNKTNEEWEGNVSFSDFSVDYARLASAPVNFRSVDFDYFINATIEPYEKLVLDSASTFSFNGFSFHPYLLYEHKDSLPHFHVEFHRDSFAAQPLFDALPKDVFPHLEGIKTNGSLSYDFSFDLDMNAIDSVKFFSSLSKLDFSIDKFGATDFRSVASPFVYHFYDKGVEETSFLIGEENPDFAPLDEISTYLKHAVLYSEDGLFYVHKGFLETALNAAIAKDVKEKRFVRGGSTISMQLVKNLWLSREKTLARKLEEAMIVWLIENNRLLTKDRMYEIYLNAIEWGPHVFGAKQASHFYFAKEPSELTPEEAIFMASIIPRPKKFMWFFDENQELKPFLYGYFDLLGDKLLKHDIITADQRESLTHNVAITGAARVYLRTPVTKVATPVVGEADDESVLMESLDKPREDDENISNESDKAD